MKQLETMMQQVFSNLIYVSLVFHARWIHPNHSDLFDPKTCSTLLNIKNVLIGCDCIIPHLVRHPSEFQKLVIQSDKVFSNFYKILPKVAESEWEGGCVSSEGDHYDHHERFTLTSFYSERVTRSWLKITLPQVKPWGATKTSPDWENERKTVKQGGKTAG